MTIGSTAALISVLFLFQGGPYQNHHRWYSPDLGRYLSSEPLLKDPWFVGARAALGRATHAYSYGASKPLNFIDRNGLWDGPYDADVVNGYDAWGPESYRDMIFQKEIGGAVGAAAGIVGTLAWIHAPTAVAALLPAAGKCSDPSLAERLRNAGYSGATQSMRHMDVGKVLHYSRTMAQGGWDWAKRGAEPISFLAPTGRSWPATTA